MEKQQKDRAHKFYLQGERRRKKKKALAPAARLRRKKTNRSGESKTMLQNSK